MIFRSRKKELDGEVFEILLTFTDFVSFKELVLDYKAVSMLWGDNLSWNFVLSCVSRRLNRKQSV